MQWFLVVLILYQGDVMAKMEAPFPNMGSCFTALDNLEETYNEKEDEEGISYQLVCIEEK